MPIEQELSTFLQGPAISTRRDQIERFRPIAKEILRELVSKENITDEDLSGLIHLFRPNPLSRELAGKYLTHIVADPDKAAALADRLVAIGLGGFTAPGRLRIHGHTSEQLHIVHDLLRSAFTVSTSDEAARLCAEYEQHTVRYVTAGIYSPWLHYIAPEFFPILNGATRSFYRAQGLPKDYPELVEQMTPWAEKLGMQDYGLLDSFVWQQANAEQKDPKDGAWRKAKWIKKVSREDWELFFDACNEVIDTFGFDADSPLLAMNMHLKAMDGVLMNVSNRATIDMHLGEGTDVMLMLPKGATKRLLSEEEIVDTFDFSKPANAEGTRVTMQTFRHRLNDLLPSVMDATKEIIGRSQSSPFRKHHIPDLYRMATDADFRERALDFLLDGKGEWPATKVLDQEVNYWVFQANPKWYDALGALRDNAVDRWSLDAHKLKIKPGDKAIIWLTGPEGGCCALATVTSAAAPMEDWKPEYSRRAEFSGVHDRVRVSIDHNLWDRPISKTDVQQDLPDLKAGIQGTTFSATKEQYDFFLRRATATKANTMHDLNTILYGPPGTGKTYNTAVFALAILEGRPVSSYANESRTAIRERFEQFTAKRRVLMTTFHQSMSYEDFVEGIKPESDPETGQVTYSVEPGIFRRLVVEAAFEYVKASRGADLEESPFDELFAHYTDHVDEQLAAGKVIKILTKSGKELQVVDVSSRGNVLLKHVNSTTTRQYVVSLERTRALSAAFPDLDAIANIDSAFRAVIGGSNGTAYWAVLKQVRSMPKAGGMQKQVPAEELIFVDKQPLVDRLNWSDRTIHAKKVDPFVLIVDEINRGNIASIFGELITLLEPDKRAFATENARVMLPYSKTMLSVPPNLFIIGTMNTADRSVEALDTALRRRFSFVEMPSRPELLEQPENLTVDLRALLHAINGRIERLLDRDHHIGHSYFMGVRTMDDLRLVFKNKVLPLLQEYFYGDPRKLGAVLGPKWVVKREATSHKLFKFDIDDAAKDIFDVADPMEVDAEAFTSIHA